MNRILSLLLLFIPGFLSAQVSETLTTGSQPAGWTSSGVAFETTAGGRARFSGSPSFLITPSMTLTAGAAIQFEIGKHGSGGDNPFFVDISDDNGATWTAQTFSVTPTSSTFMMVSQSISVVGPDVKIRFRKDAAGAQRKLKNVTITNALPVELTSFDAKKSNNSIQLNWETASERNNKEFVVERSATAAGFAKIASLDGAGNIESTQTYSYTDDAPLAGTNYYRLRQVDFDGTTSFSDIVKVEFSKETSVTMYPNPTAGMVFFKQETQDYSEKLLQLYDGTGRILRTIQMQAGEEIKQVDLSDFAEGIYYVRELGSDKGQILIKQ